jgi:hypothetical protein
MLSIDYEVVPTAWCDSLLLRRIVAEVGCRLAPSFFWSRGILSSLLCSG